MKISVVTTLYKSAPHIGEFVERSRAELKKLTDDYELVFVDDGSPDDSLRTALALLPPVLGGAPTQPLEVGRSSRVVLAAQRNALTVRAAAAPSPAARDHRGAATPTTSTAGSTAATRAWRTCACCAGSTTS
jgi:hypothetical protein